MKTELINEFYLLQQSRSNANYEEVLEERVYEPVKKANIRVSTWMEGRGMMLMNLENTLNRSVRRLRKKYFKF
jgi:hypothetical protein